MTVALIGIGPNDLKIPCLFFSSMKNGKKFTEKLLGPGIKQEDGSLYFPLHHEEFNRKEGQTYFVATTPEFRTLFQEKVSKKGIEDNDWHNKDKIYKKTIKELGKEKSYLKAPSKTFFTSYYGDCGECSGFILKKIEMEKPILRWNLD